MFSSEGAIYRTRADEIAPDERALTAHTENQQDRTRAGSIRVASGLFTLVALPLLSPAAKGYLPVLVAYLAGAILFQQAIRRDIGGEWRVFAGGLMDVAFITFLVHRLGSSSTTLVASYLLIGMFNALVASAWVARVVGVIAILSYAGVAYLEALHYLPYAPDHPDLFSSAPDVFSATRSVVLLASLIIISTSVSDRIARALRKRTEQLKLMNARLEELSQRDPLTQLYNRRYFVARVDEELARVRRGRPMCLVMIDLDGFKHINDKQGHIAGDDLLRRIARTIEESTRAVDVVARYGGDEFVALLPDTDAEQAGIVAARLVQAIRHVGAAQDPRRPVTASVGVAIARPEDDVTVLLNAADDGCYRAKQAGGDRYETVLSTTRESGSSFESGPRAASAG